MRIFKLSVFFLLIGMLGANAQDDERAIKAVKEFSQKMQTVKSISANFTFTLENLQENITDTHQGKIILKGNMYWLELMGMELFFDGKTKWQYIKDANEVTISTPNGGDGGFMDDPTTLFRDYDKNFKSKFKGQKQVRNRVIYEMDFYPRNLNLPYSSVKLEFDRNSLEPILIRYQGKDGNNYIIKVKNFRTNIPVRDDRFTFNAKKFKGVEVVDMR
ncbi:MAG TPA: outer membrane lipoprotein carrier protein LolA [Tenuifilaceae bacterium]|nr:outer membrane lipoprotein carrier protein LolA [Tenuifilaceae bacterium]